MPAGETRRDPTTPLPFRHIGRTKAQNELRFFCLRLNMVNNAQWRCKTVQEIHMPAFVRH